MFDYYDDDEDYVYKEPSYFDHFVAACQTFFIVAVFIIGVGIIL